MKPTRTAVVFTTYRRRLALLAMGVAAAASVGVPGVPALAQTVTLRPGQYEATSELALPAGSPVKIPPQKDVICITAEDLRDLPTKIVKGGPFQNCKVTEQTVTATGIKFTKECTGPDGKPVMYIADVTFTSSESYRQVVHMSGGSGRGNNSPIPRSTMTGTAKRVGDCTK
jgi:hypothetical protein